MILIEENRDLATVDTDEYYLAHCISYDFAKVTGVSVELDEHHNIKNRIKERYGDDFITRYPNMNCILSDNKVFNLIIKTDYNLEDKYRFLEESLYSMRKILLDKDNVYIIKTNKIAISKKEYSLYELDWDRVKNIITKVFQDTNVEFLVCS